MPAAKTLLGLVLRAAAMAVVAGILMRLFGLARALAALFPFVEPTVKTQPKCFVMY